ncbi:MAG: hypothetical protein U1C55_06435 [Smithellaceae bacterium]|nr:hypothetical protein [Smithellaceae bacterium]
MLLALSGTGSFEILPLRSSTRGETPKLIKFHDSQDWQFAAETYFIRLFLQKRESEKRCNPVVSSGAPQSCGQKFLQGTAT